MVSRAENDKPGSSPGAAFRETVFHVKQNTKHRKEEAKSMIDYEALILERQENIEIWEDEPESPYLQQAFESGNWWDEIPEEDFEVVTVRKYR